MDIIIIIILLLIVGFIIYLKMKTLKLPNVSIITGGVKTGKTTLAVYLAIQKYKSSLFKWRLRKYLLRKKEEMPLLYSNIRLTCPHVLITKDLLLREKRFAYKSVVLISECSLVADAQNFSDKYVNDVLTCFNKLFGHETKGGILIYDTQNISDVHFSIKKCINQYVWIHSLNKFIPFMLYFKVREMAYSYDNNVINTSENDLEDSTKWLLIPKSIWRVFDSYCYSIFTDNLPLEDNIVQFNKNDLKTNDIIQLREFNGLKKGDFENERK